MRRITQALVLLSFRGSKGTGDRGRSEGAAERNQWQDHIVGSVDQKIASSLFFQGVCGSPASASPLHSLCPCASASLRLLYLSLPPSLPPAITFNSSLRLADLSSANSLPSAASSPHTRATVSACAEVRRQFPCTRAAAAAFVRRERRREREEHEA